VVSLGDVVAIEEVDPAADFTGLPARSTCDTSQPVRAFGNPSNGVTFASFDPTSDEVMVWVYRQVRVTYALEAVTITPEATPAN